MLANENQISVFVYILNASVTVIQIGLGENIFLIQLYFISHFCPYCNEDDCILLLKKPIIHIKNETRGARTIQRAVPVL